MAGTRIRSDVLRVELAKRGWNGSDLARAARMSPGTVSGAMQGHRVSARTLMRIAEALHRQPVVPTAEDLILQ